MATYRIGIGSFNLKDGAVGIGTESTGLGNLKVEGTYKVTDLDVTGVSTFTRYAGFAPDNLEIGKDSRDRTLTGEHFTTGDIVVGVNSTFTVSVGATVDVGTVPSVSIGTHFSPPTGGVEERPEVPVEGTVRFNRDLNTLEFYNGFEWRQFTVSGARGRGIIFGGFEPGIGHVMIQQFEVSTLGNTTHFGDLIESTYSNGGGCSSETRGLTAGSGPGSNTIQYITIASSGNSIDFGDLFLGRGYTSGTSSSTRGIWVGGYAPSPVSANLNSIEYAQISTLGNAADFGDISSLTNDVGACASPTRAVFAGGGAGRNQIEYVTIASKGNGIDFGTMKRQSEYAGHSNAVRGIFMSRHNGSESVNLASGGNAQYFADLNINARLECATTGNMTRCVIGGGYTPAHTNSMEYVTISTEGSAADFGDMMEPVSSTPTCSDSHGGLGGY